MNKGDYYVTYRIFGGPSALSQTVAPTVYRVASCHTSLDAAKRALRRNNAVGIALVSGRRKPGDQIWP